MAEDNAVPAPALTRDNTHLSRPIQAGAQTASAAVSNPHSLQDHADAKVLEFIAAATSPNTRRAYQSDIEHFIARGGCIPATQEKIARYLAHYAASFSMATLARRLAGIRAAHVQRGFSDPTKGELVRLTLRGIRRRHGQPQRRVAALSTGDLLAIVRSLGQSVRDIRDTAILLVGFSGAFRRSELISLDCNDVEIGEFGATIVLRRSKTDQNGHGRVVSIPRVQEPMCPVAALERWLCISKIVEGSVFRRVTRSGKVRQSRISADSIAHIIKTRIQSIGRDPTRYSGHSLRAGFVTEAARTGMPMWRIKAQTGHLSDSMLERYIREGELASADAVRMISASVTGQLSSALHEIETQQVSPT
jgi:integrase